MACDFPLDSTGDEPAAGVTDLEAGSVSAAASSAAGASAAAAAVETLLLLLPRGDCWELGSACRGNQLDR